MFRTRQLLPFYFIQRSDNTDYKLLFYTMVGYNKALTEAC
jgi:hypothetical protein